MKETPTNDNLAARHSWGLHQSSLFTSSLDEFEAETGVSADEMDVWRKKDWLSFSPHKVPEFDERERVEVAFISGLARSGLSDAMVARLLDPLPKPYCYDPATTFYSFRDRRWISLPPEPEPATVTNEYLDSLIEDKDWDSLHDLRDRLTQVLTDAGAKLEEH